MANVTTICCRVAALLLLMAATALPASAQQQQRQQQPRQQPAQPSQQPAQQPQQPQTPRELPPAGTAFVVVDVARIFSESAAARSVRSQVDKQRNAYLAEVSKQEKELRAADEELAKQRAILSPEAFAQRRRELEKRVADAQAQVNARRRAFDQAVNESMQRVDREMNQVIGEIVSERNYQVVLSRASVVIYQTALDITPEVMRRLNQKLPSVQVNIPKN